MRNLTTVKYIYIYFCLLFACQTVTAQLFINEFMASNDATITDEFGDYDDWVEIYNAGTSPVNIAGYYLTDDLAEPNLWQIPSTNASLTTIAAGGHMLLWFDKESEQGLLHVEAKLSGSGEEIGIYDSNLNLIDSYAFDAQFADVSEGRVSDGDPSWDNFGTSTPNAPNTNPGASAAVAPIYSQNGGLFTGTINIELSSLNPNAVIYYTLDGSLPDDDSEEYSGPISLNAGTSVRAIAYAPGVLPSAVTTQTYLFDISHTFAILTVAGDNAEFFDPATGIYPNYTQDIEINSNIEMYLPDGTQTFNNLLETEIQGTGSAGYPQKSLGMKAKSSLGSSTIDYQIFPDLDFEQLRSIVARNSGQDWNITMFRDAMVSSLVRDLSDVNDLIEAPKLYTQGYRPGVLYLNGEYWGIHNIRERMDKRYIKTHFGLDDNEIDFLEDDLEVKEGDIGNWKDLSEFLQFNTLESDANFDYVASQVDVDHYLDYIVFNVFIDNADWPGKNNKRWREKTEDGQWRWMTWDLDFTFGLYQSSTGSFNSGAWWDNSLGRLLYSSGYNWPNPEWATLLFRRLVQNEKWRTKFINRMADQINVLYNEDRTLGRIQYFQNLYQGEMQQHADRWAEGYINWLPNVDKLRVFAQNRVSTVHNHFVGAFNDINGITEITLNASPSNGGGIKFNTVFVNEDDFPWSGTYFTGIEIPVSAIPAQGYVFTGWSDASLGNNPEVMVSLSQAANLTAFFAPGSSSTSPIVINEINYNSPDAPNTGDWIELYNPNNFAVDISGWSFQDEGDDFYGFPANTFIAANAYIILVEDRAEFEIVYPQVSAVYGNFGGDPGFKLGNGGEAIYLKNASGNIIDFVEYDDNTPWPDEADGDGPTLQLISPNLDNEQAGNWIAQQATPGLINLVDANAPPTVILSTNAANVFGDFTVNIDFSEPVDNFDINDLSISNGSAYGFSGNGANYTVQIATQSTGLVTVNVGANAGFDFNGLGNLASNQLDVNVLLQQSNPTVQLTTDSDVVIGSFIVNIIFNEDVFGLTLPELIINNGTSSDPSGSGGFYSFTVTPINFGDITISLPANAAFNTAGFGNIESNILTVLYSQFGSNDPPTVSLTTSTNIVTGSFQVNATFDQNITGFTASDLSIVNGTVTGFSGFDDSYSFTVNPISSGQISLSLPEDSATNSSNIGNVASNNLTVIYQEVNSSNPTVVLSTANLVVDGDFIVDITFNVAVTDLMLSEIVITNGTASNPSGWGANYSFTVSPINEGLITMYLPANSGFTGTGEGNLASNILEVNYSDGNNSDGVDLELSIAVDDQYFSIFSEVNYQISVTNSGNVASNSARIEIPIPLDMAYTTHEGDYNLYNRLWSIGTLNPGETKKLFLTLFTLTSSNPLTLYAQIVEQSPADIDSTPNNGNGATANEDDEAAVTISPNVSLDNFSFGLEDEASIVVSKLFPNPVQDELNIQLLSNVDKSVSYKIYEVSGKMCGAANFLLAPGYNNYKIETHHLTPGIYMIVFDQSDLLKPQRFVKVGE